ncbi:ATP-dependent zinc metalloprotease FtsH [Lusitaniella coriacea]|uniref:ATP-dependent zinc metalloprotease FtsH n=1 Tax=Lusitaniella coriacea TaxID=1983105 RepID=UPI003CF8A5E3
MAIKKKPRTPRAQKITTILLLLASSALLIYTFRPRPQIPRVPYSFFLLKVKAGEVESVGVAENLLRFKLKPDEQYPQGVVLSTLPVEDLELPERLEKEGIQVGFVATRPPKNNGLLTILSWVVPALVMVGGLQYLRSRDAKAEKGSLAFGKSKAKVYIEGESEKITFSDVAGVEEAKIELQEIVEFLKNPTRFQDIGARIPKGVLLVGPPGTGKTLLAKAVAGEAGVSFFSISASEFVELFVGTGAARVRDLFDQAKKKAPCIIFIDELDAIGKSRSGGGGFQSGSNSEQEQTLNQLLTEMDGFGVGDATVIVLAATNRPEALDAALLRPGRFDRQVLVDRPDLAGRLKILEVYAKKVKLGADINLKDIATQTPGFAGADLANLVNEAALLAARNQRTEVAQEDFKEAIERVIAGLEKKSRVLNPQEKKVVAYHEVGHALVGALMPGGSKVAKISIVPRGMDALGYTLSLPTEDRFLLNEVELRDRIVALLGGRAAEEVVFEIVTTGASDDLQRATGLAERMVTTYGMSKVLGPLTYDKAQGNSFLGNAGGNIRRVVSEKTAEAIDNEVKELVETGYEQALAILRHNRDLLDAIARQLLETEAIEGEELQTLLNRVQPVP